MGIYLIAGQSNAAGRGTIPLLPAVYAAAGYGIPYAPVQHVYKIEDTPTDPLVFDFDQAKQDLTFIPSGNGTYGVELSLGRRLYALGRAPSLAKMAIGSSSLAVHWKAVGSTYPTADPKLFTQFVSYATAALTTFSSTIAGVVWVQGEADASSSGQAAAYAANLTELINTFRATFPGVPFYLNRLHYLCGSAFVNTVRAAQDQVARTVPGVVVFSADDLELSGAHYTSPALITLGERFADAIAAGASPAFGFGAGLRGYVRGGLVGGLIGGIASLGGAGAGSTTFPPVAAFTTSPAGLTINFTDTSSTLTGSITSRSWSFGDGSTSTSTNPSHAFAAEGTYNVTLTVTNTAGLSASITTAVTVVLWSIDATSSKAAPATSAEWTNFLAANPSLGMSAPGSLWLFQDASGNLADAIGGKTLTVTGTPLYRQTESGWSRKFISASGAAANQFAANGAMANAGTTSVLLLLFARMVQPVAGHQRAFWGGASSNAFEGIAGSSNIRIRTGANSGNGTLSHVGAVRPFVIHHDVTNSLNTLYSNIEKKAITYGAAVGASVQFQFGVAADTTANTLVGYSAGWSGASAEFGNIAAADAKVKALLQAMGFTVTGY